MIKVILFATTVMLTAQALAAENCQTKSDIDGLATDSGFVEITEAVDVTDPAGHWDLAVAYGHKESGTVRIVWFNAGCLADYNDLKPSDAINYFQEISAPKKPPGQGV